MTERNPLRSELISSRLLIPSRLMARRHGAGGRRPRGRERGISTVEYVIILVLVACVAIAGWRIFGVKVKCALGMANDQMVLLEDGTPSGSPCPNTGGGSDGEPSDSDGPSPTSPSPADRPKRKVVN